MVDTVKIPRPKFPRKKNAGGRVEHDARGNGIWRRSRAEDATELTIPSELTIVEDSRPAAKKVPRKKT
jgi:hypothetical protein